MQMMFDSVQHEVLAARVRRAQLSINELMSEIESRLLSRDELAQKVKDVEKNLRKTREDI